MLSSSWFFENGFGLNIFYLKITLLVVNLKFNEFVTSLMKQWNSIIRTMWARKCHCDITTGTNSKQSIFKGLSCVIRELALDCIVQEMLFSKSTLWSGCVMRPASANGNWRPGPCYRAQMAHALHWSLRNHAWHEQQLMYDIITAIISIIHQL